MRIVYFFRDLIDSILHSGKTVLLLFIIAAAAGGAAYYFYQQNQKVLHLLNNPAQASTEEVKMLTDKIGALMDLPSGEDPTSITVVDKEKLKDQAFFDKAENGDKVLVYTQAKKAILYRPSTNKIIEIGPVDITPSQTFKVALYYSLGGADEADRLAKILKDKVSNLDVEDKVAAGGTYAKNLVVDLKGDKSSEAKDLAELIDAEIGTLPSGETKPEADFLVIAVK